MSKTLLACLGLAIFTASSVTNAATIVTSFDSWIATVDSPYVTDFNEVSEDISFRDQPLDYAGMTYSVNGPGFNAFGNQIDASPFIVDDNPFYAIDGSSYVLVDLLIGNTFTIRFDTQQNLFGATFAGLAGGTRVETIQLLEANGNVIDSFVFADQPRGDETGYQLFLGISSDTKFSSINFISSRQPDSLAINDVFGIDNIWRSQIGAVPEPATWAFMIFGFGAIGGAMRRQRKVNLKASQV